MATFYERLAHVKLDGTATTHLSTTLFQSSLLTTTLPVQLERNRSRAVVSWTQRKLQRITWCNRRLNYSLAFRLKTINIDVRVYNNNTRYPIAGWFAKSIHPPHPQKKIGTRTYFSSSLFGSKSRIYLRGKHFDFDRILSCVHYNRIH